MNDALLLSGFRIIFLGIFAISLKFILGNAARLPFWPFDGIAAILGGIYLVWWSCKVIGESDVNDNQQQGLPPDKAPSVSLPQLCYDVAYFILPHYAFKDLAKLVDLCLNTPTAAGPLFYLMAAQAHQVEPSLEDAQRFRWHHKRLEGSRQILVLEFPVPPQLDVSEVEMEQVISGDKPLVLAPHFSAIICSDERKKVEYFILGQAPIGGGTTLRCILPDGVNCNLGPGPRPELSAFLEALPKPK